MASTMSAAVGLSTRIRACLIQTGPLPQVGQLGAVVPGVSRRLKRGLKAGLHRRAGNYAITVTLYLARSIAQRQLALLRGKHRRHRNPFRFVGGRSVAIRAACRSASRWNAYALSAGCVVAPAGSSALQTELVLMLTRPAQARTILRIGRSWKYHEKQTRRRNRNNRQIITHVTYLSFSHGDDNRDN